MKLSAIRLVTVMLGLLVPGAAVAQVGTIEGTVRDARTGDPIEGASVTVTGTALAGTSNLNGFFQITGVPTGPQTVRVRVVGYQPQVVTNVTVSGGVPAAVNFQLEVSIFRMEGVVVAGVSEAVESTKLPFTVDQLKTEDLPVAPVSAFDGVQGKVAAARVRTRSGLPDEEPSILLRGVTSLNTSGRSNAPLYVVDGVILAGARTRDIDGLQIENIEVVKGASAAALYGSRAANGVVSITTRRGAGIPEGETRFTFRTEVGASNLTRVLDRSTHHPYRVDANGQWLDATGAVLTPDTTFNTDGSVAGILSARAQRQLDEVVDSTLQDLDGDGTPETWVPHSYAVADNEFGGPLYNQLKQFYDPGSFYTVSGDVAHRSGATNFLLSGHTTKQTGVIQGLDGLRRSGARLNVDHRVGPRLDLSASAYYTTSNADSPFPEGSFPIFEIMFTEPDVRLDTLFDPPRDSVDFLTPVPGSTTPFVDNALYLSNNVDASTRRSRILGSVYTAWRPTDWLEIRGDLSLDRWDEEYREYYFRGFRAETPLGIAREDGHVRREDSFSEALNGSASVLFTGTYGDLNVVGTGRLLVERVKSQQGVAFGSGLLATDVQSLDLADPNRIGVRSLEQEIRTVSYFTGAQLDFRDTYIADLLVRRDGSSLFGSDERWQTYYRLSGAYRMAQESFWPFAFLDEFKLRLSRGTAGGRPRFNAQYETFAVQGTTLRRQTLGNTTLRPEKAAETEAGVDLLAWGRLSASISHARSTVDDQILLVPLPSNTGFTEQWQNAGTIKSNTWEATIQAALVQQRDVSWNLSFVFDRTRSVIEKLAVNPYRDGVFFFQEGETLGSMWGIRWATSCSDILTDGGFGAACDAFDTNDEGYLVPVGQGNVFTDGIASNLYGSRITIDGVEFNWGEPVRSHDIVTRTLLDGSQRVDTTTTLPIGNTMPDYNVGIANDFRWRNLGLYVLFEASVGADLYNVQLSNDYRFGWIDQFGKDELLKKPLSYYQTQYATASPSGAFVENGTYVKMRELSLRYTFGRDALEPIFQGVVNRVSLSLIGRNLLTWSDFSGFDPEMTAFEEGAIFGQVFTGMYPSVRTFTATIELEF